MAGSPWVLAGFFAAGCLAVVGHSFFTRAPLAQEKAAQRPVSSSRAANDAPTLPAVETAYDVPSRGDASASASMQTRAAAQMEAPGPTSPPDAAAVPEGESAVSKWVEDATGEDPKARAEAIAALAHAPKDAALPALKKVLTGGEPEVDRPLALASLRTLALEQGDADGRIKELLRQTLSHADDERLAEAAQAVLDEVP